MEMFTEGGPWYPSVHHCLTQFYHVPMFFFPFAWNDSGSSNLIFKNFGYGFNITRHNLDTDGTTIFNISNNIGRLQLC